MPIKAIQQFPNGFLWGCATAAHQVEGDNTNDWWRWEQKPGRIFQDQHAGRACEWWAGRYLEDFDRAVDLNNNAQRLSIEWSRIEPEPGKWDQAALDQYRAMLEALRDRGLKPMVTLHHFSNPLWIDDHTGWLWDEVPTYFARFARKVVSELGDLCDFWCTINEPLVYGSMGYVFGKWPPGMKSIGAFFHVAVNLLRGHAAAYYAIKEVQPHSQVGYSNHQVTFQPLPPVAVNGMVTNTIDHIFNKMFANTIRDGVMKVFGLRPIRIPEVKNTLDWVGLQYYQQFHLGIDLRHPETFFMAQRKPTNMQVGPGDWGGLSPDPIFNHIRWLTKTLQKPIYITESGVPDPDDSFRPTHLVETIRAVWRAVNFNFPVRGFFVWSLIDNFEWAEGYDPRFSFGLYHTDFATQQRIARPSAALYAEICAQNGLSAETVERHVPSALEKLFPDATPQNMIKWQDKKSRQG